jgi:hypothetical protein
MLVLAAEVIPVNEIVPAVTVDVIVVELILLLTLFAILLKYKFDVRFELADIEGVKFAVNG